MKLKVLTLATALFLTLASGCAHDRDSVANSENPSQANGTYLTGSNLPQDVERNGPVTNGKSNVRVIDDSDINRSGGGNLNQSLRQLGVTP